MRKMTMTMILRSIFVLLLCAGSIFGQAPAGIMGFVTYQNGQPANNSDVWCTDLATGQTWHQKTGTCSGPANFFLFNYACPPGFPCYSGPHDFSVVACKGGQMSQVERVTLPDCYQNVGTPDLILRYVCVINPNRPAGGK